MTTPARMHEKICAFPSKTLYASKLQSHASVATHLLRDLPNASANASKDGSGDEDPEEVLQHPVVFFDTSGCEYFERVDSARDGDGNEQGNGNSNKKDREEGSRSNENEGMVVKNWVEKLVRLPISCYASYINFISWATTTTTTTTSIDSNARNTTTSNRSRQASNRPKSL